MHGGAFRAGGAVAAHSDESALLPLTIETGDRGAKEGRDAGGIARSDAGKGAHGHGVVTLGALLLGTAVAIPGAEGKFKGGVEQEEGQEDRHERDTSDDEDLKGLHGGKVAQRG